jgi:hypothetical protein
MEFREQFLKNEKKRQNYLIFKNLIQTYNKPILHEHYKTTE